MLIKVLLLTTLLADTYESTTFRLIEQARKQQILQTIKSPKFVQIQNKITGYISNQKNKKESEISKEHTNKQQFPTENYNL